MFPFYRKQSPSLNHLPTTPETRCSEKFGHHHRVNSSVDLRSESSSFLVSMAKLGLQMARRLHSSHDATHVSAGMAKARTTLQSLTLDRLTEKPLSNIRSFFERRSSGSGSSSNDCSNNNTGTQCQKASATDNVTLPVALGVWYATLIPHANWAYLLTRLTVFLCYLPS